MKNLNLLILDDEDVNINNYKKDIELFNLTNNDYNFTIYDSKTIEQAKVILQSEDINYAIVDLNLHCSEQGTGNSGNDLINLIKSKYHIPTVIISGFLNDLYEGISENIFMQTIERDKANTPDVLKQFCTLDKCGIPDVFSQDGKLNTIIKEAFWTQIANGFDLVNSESDIDSDVLLRFISNYIKESLSYDSNGEDIPYHPFEFYIIPPINDKINSGSILKFEGKNFVVLTPACDIANSKTNNIQIVEIKSYKEISDINKCIKEVELKPENFKKIEKRLSKILSNNHSLKYHFLPPHKNFNGGVINFQTVKSIPKTEIQEQATIIGNITSDFLKDITSRFATYYSRQGQPTLSDASYIFKSIYKQ